MPDLPPRLDVNPPTQTGYAPISWTAVASLGVGVVFAAILGVMSVLAFWSRQPLIQPLMFFGLAALTLVLAFVARRQIASSEGTRTGVGYANTGWWIAVVGGLGYAAYLVALEYDVRRQAEQVFVKWTDNLTDLDPNNPRDSKLYAAAYLTIDPGYRSKVGSPENVAEMDRTFRDQITSFRQMDLVRLSARNPGQVRFRPDGLQDWQQKPTEISCTLAATALSPEGEHRLLVPIRAVVDPNTKQRQWQVNLARQGYFAGRELTPYGWMIEYLDRAGRAFTQDFLGRLASPGQSQFAYLAFVHPKYDPVTGTQAYKRISETILGRSALTGPVSLLPVAQPGLTDEYEYLSTTLFGRPNGTPLAPSDLKYLDLLWNVPGRLSAAGGPGAVLKGNPDVNPVLAVDGGRIEFRFPLELATASDSPVPGAARGRLVLRMPPGAEARWLSDLAAAREAAGGAAKTAEPPRLDLTVPPWRVVRIESDFVPQFPMRPPSQTGGPPPGGM